MIAALPTGGMCLLSCSKLTLMFRCSDVVWLSGAALALALFVVSVVLAVSLRSKRHRDQSAPAVIATNSDAKIFWSRAFVLSLSVRPAKTCAHGS